MRRHPIHIPKTGTWSVKDGMQRAGVELIVNGHKPASDVRAKIWIQTGDRCELGATIRNPEDRLVSMMNHLWGNNPLVSTEEAFQQVIDDEASKSQIFRTARWHIDDHTRLFPFEGLPILRWLGYDGALPHANESKARWSVAELRHHPLWEAAMAPYEGDWPLYDFALKNCGACLK
jgi:hypothetical protein